MNRKLTVIVCVAGFAVLAGRGAAARQVGSADEESAALAKKLSNPLSDLVSEPFQFNWEQKVGSAELSRFVLNVQPVLPFTVTKDWNMVVRIITPFVGQPPLVTGGESTFGVGDITASFWFSTSTSGGLTIGAGPAFGLPSTYQPTIGSGKWSAGGPR